MKKVMAAIFSLFIVLANFGLSMAADQDEKGGKDHPLLSRMPDFRISDYGFMGSGLHIAQIQLATEGVDVSFQSVIFF